jgi:hypothetical protein
MNIKALVTKNITAMSHFAEVFQRISYYEDRIFGAL